MQVTRLPRGGKVTTSAASKRRRCGRRRLIAYRPWRETRDGASRGRESIASPIRAPRRIEFIDRRVLVLEAYFRTRTLWVFGHGTKPQTVCAARSRPESGSSCIKARRFPAT
eukprot:23490-Pelagococcus_subviridis.AAC.3